MEDDFEIELESDQPTAGSEVPEVEEPVGDDDKQVETSEEASEVDSSDEDANDKEEENPTEAAPKESKFDKDLDEWAVKKGHEAPENDRERKLLQNLRDSDREFTKEREAKKGQKAIENALKTEKDELPVVEEEIFDPLEKEVRELKRANANER